MVTSKQLADALVASVSENPKNHNDILRNFEIFLEKKHLKELLPNIVRHLEEKLKYFERQESLEIITSHKINKETINFIEQFVKKNSQSNTKITEDEKLIGGFIAKYKGIVYDGSVRNQLNQLKALLIK